MFKKMDYVYTVYKERSFTRAAEKLYISQPCLSAAIKKIEEEIGMPLLERRYSSVRPTEIGYQYIEAAEKIMEIQQNFASKVSDINNMETGSISIGGSNYVSSYILPRVVAEFSKYYPKIDISLTETNSVDLEKSLNNEEIDLVIDSFDDEKVIHKSYPLLNEKILLAVPAGYKCNQGVEKYQIMPERIYNSELDFDNVPKIPISYFANEKFILLKNGNNMYKHAMEVFRSANVTPTVSFRLDQLSTSYRLALSGNGVCFVTDTIFKYHKFHNDIILYNIENCGNRTLYVAQKRNRYTTSAMNKFVEIAQKSI